MGGGIDERKREMAKEKKSLRYAVTGHGTCSCLFTGRQEEDGEWAGTSSRVHMIADLCAVYMCHRRMGRKQGLTFWFNHDACVHNNNKGIICKIRL